jgi:Xaa-Pro aminopeptidase
MPHPHFDAEEFAARLARVRDGLARAEVALGLFDEIEAMSWISGYGNSENRWRVVGIPLAGEPFFLIRALDAGPCRERSWIADVRSFRDWEDPMPALAAILAERGLAKARIGLDLGSYCMPPARFAGLKAALPEAQLIDLGPLIAELRLIKSEAEIALLRRAAAVADTSLLRAAAACVPGASQRDAAVAAMASFMEEGADPSAPGPISAGGGWDFLHAALDDATLAPGSLVHIEVTPRIGGYSARTMRCVALGTPPPALTDAAARLAAIQDAQIAAMRPGAEAAAIDSILRQGVLGAGLREAFDNITGYTLGLYAPAGPRTSDFTRCFHPQATFRLAAGMVFHMYVSAAGVSLSETVLVSEAGPERLTNLPRTLLVNP